jgi:hypothetical protein
LPGRIFLEIIDIRILFKTPGLIKTVEASRVQLTDDALQTLKFNADFNPRYTTKNKPGLS